MKGLTEKQKNIIEFINEFMDKNEMAPTIYEIAENFKIKTSTVFAHIRALQKKACLTRSSKARSISLAKPRRRTRYPAGMHCIPIMESADSRKKERDLFCDAALFMDYDAKKEDLYALHVTGSDLQDCGIYKGDIVIVKGNPENVHSGDIVVTELNGQDVLSHCSPKTDDSRLKGVVVGLQRRIGQQEP